MKQWLALYIRPRHEKKAADRLQRNGIEVFCPLIKSIRQWKDRKKKVSLPMFPSYVFVYTEEQERHKILQDPAVLNFVFWLGKPAVIRDHEIEAIKYIAGHYEAGEVKISSPDYNKGDYVYIQEGPFQGMKGIVEDSSGDHIYLLIDELGCQIKISGHQTRKINDAEKS